MTVANLTFLNVASQKDGQDSKDKQEFLLSQASTSIAGKSSDAITVENVREGFKVLAVAIRKKIAIRYGCASCRCGSCAVKVESGALSVMEADEKQLLEKMGIYSGKEVRLSCRSRMEKEDVSVDLDFQKSYDPADRGFDSSTIKYPSS